MRGEVLDGPERRRRWSEDEKTTILAELAKPGMRGTEVARRHGVSSGLLYTWRKERRAAAVPATEMPFAPVLLTGPAQRPSIKADPFSGTVFVFRAKRADRVKLVYWDGTGLCLFAKTLEDGRFRWPKIEDGVMRLTQAQLGALIEGLDWMRVHAEDTAAPTASA